MIDVEVPVLGKPSESGDLRILRRISRSRALAVLWTTLRIWLGIQWINAGRAKLWGSENSAFMHHDGAGVAGFATHGAASYTWWHHFLTGFVVPNSGWIGILVSVSEFVIGVALVLGVFTPGFAFAGLVLNVTYMLSGTAGVNPAYAAASVLLILMWRTSGWIGVDGIAMGIWQRRRGRSSIGVHSNGTRPVAEPTPPADPGRPVSPGTPIPAV